MTSGSNWKGSLTHIKPGTAMFKIRIYLFSLILLLVITVVFLYRYNVNSIGEGEARNPIGREAAKENETPVIGLANMSDAMEFSINVKNSIIQEAKKRGWTVVVLDNALDGIRALHNTDSLIQEKVDYIIMFNAEASAQSQIAKTIKAAGIPAIALDLPLPGYPLLGVNNELAGEMCGEYLADYAKSYWKHVPDLFIILDSTATGTSMQIRGDACEKGLKSRYPDFPTRNTIHLDTRADILSAKSKMADILAKRPDARFIAVAGVNDQLCAAGLAILEAMQRDKDAVICSLGADTTFLKQFKASKGQSAWKAAVAFTPEAYGKSLIPLIQQELSGMDIPQETWMKLALIDKTTIWQYYPDFAW